MSKVFLVSSGSYSDYTILAVFSHVDMAREYADRLIARGRHNDNVDVEPFDIDIPVADCPRLGYCIVMCIDGNVTWESTYASAVEEPYASLLGGSLSFSGYGRDREAALRSATQLRADVLVLQDLGLDPFPPQDVPHADCIKISRSEIDAALSQRLKEKEMSP